MYVKNTDKIPEDHELRVSRVGEKGKEGYYTWETKVDVLTKLHALGNMREVSRLTKIPYDTIREWKHQDWYPKLMDEVKRNARTELNTKMSRIVNKALAAVEERIDNGDYVLNNKTGEILRKPVSLKDASKVVSELQGQQLKMEELDNKVTQKEETVQETLKMLAAEFSKWVSKTRKEEAVSIEFKEVTNAVHDQRKEGLQEGI